MEITSDEPIPLSELEDIIKPALDARQLAELHVNRDHFYELIAISGNFHFMLTTFQFISISKLICVVFGILDKRKKFEMNFVFVC